jgi:hypothetical protein
MEPSAPLTPSERETFEALKTAAKQLWDDFEHAGYLKVSTLLKLREVLKDL